MTNSKSNSKLKERREDLNAITEEAIAIAKSKGIDIKAAKKNDLIKKYIYKLSASTTLQTFVQWQKQGYKVRAGEKAFLLWGKPVEHNAEARERDFNKPAQPITTAHRAFYPVAYLFASFQVEPFKK